VDHDRARAAFERLADNLDAVADHLVGPGLEFARRALSNAAGAATDLAAIHRDAETAETEQRETERRAAATRAALGAAYVSDLLLSAPEGNRP
jgi:hypothetical protein